jgi:hypothetical protein
MKSLRTALFLLLMTGAWFGTAAEIKFGITQTDAKQRRAEFEQSDELMKFYKGQGIFTSFCEYRFNPR